MGRAQAPRQRHVLVTGNASTLIEWVGTVQRESGPRGVTLGESPLFLLDAEPAPGLGRLAVPPRRRGLRLAYSRPLRRAFPP